jgi:hypothetical protein
VGDAAGLPRRPAGRAWLICHFIDPVAEFVFVGDSDEVPDDATAFDLPGVALSHHGDDCSFETFLRVHNLADRALVEIGRIIHEADLADERYDALEAPVLDVLIRGLSMTLDDEHVLEVTGPLFDGLYAFKQGARCSVASQSKRRNDTVKWVTREHPKTDRIACPWLIRKFIDPDAEIVYVPSDQVLAYAKREGATSFDAPDAKYTHRGTKCSFETLVKDYKIDDPAIALLARVVHGADVSEDRDATPESPGLLAIADGFALLGVDDQRQLELELPVYDALYAWA